jgi:dTDP-4-dehydrorhamnose reductase
MTREEGRPMILGAGGLLGRTLARRLERIFPDTIAATRAEIDITDSSRVGLEIERLRPTVVINCAAWTDVDGCSRDRAAAFAANAEGAGNVARAASASGSRIVHLSTDFVFDGSSGRAYAESDLPAPLQEYGRSKWEGEKLVAAAAPDHLIVRTAWMYGPSGSTFVEKIRRRATTEGSLSVVSDQHGSPTFVEDLAGGIVRLLSTGQRGIVHVANTGHCSRFELAAAILEDLGLSKSVRLRSVTTVPQADVAPRPPFAALDTALFARITGAPMRPWREALRDYLRRPSGREDLG